MISSGDAMLHRLKFLICAFTIQCVVTGQGFAMEGDAEAGAKVFRKCAACHTADKAENRVGPYLMGVVGRPVASVESYNYSEAMVAFSAGGKIWDEAALDMYLRNPRAIVRGTRMAFPGLKKTRMSLI